MKLKPVRRSIGALLLVDGIRAFARPAEYARSLQMGTPLIDDILDYLAENSHLTRNFSIAEMAIGLWLTLAK